MSQVPALPGRGKCVVCDKEIPAAEPEFRCPNCGLSGERLDDGIARTARRSPVAGYPPDGSEGTLAVEEDSFWFKHRNRAILSLIRMHPFSGPMLDVGGGNGYPARFLQDFYPSIVLVEPLAQACSNSVKRGVRRVVNGTLPDLGLKEGSIGAICFFDVLEHLEDPEEVLREGRRILAPGGRLFITAPALSMLWSAEDEYARHRRRYTRGSLSRQLVAGGFRVDYSSYYFGILVPPALLMRALPYRFGRRKSASVHRREHVPAGPPAAILDLFLGCEARLLDRGYVLPFGSSLICAARKA